MAQTVANLASVLKDAWTSDRLAKQFYNDNPILDKITDAADATMIGAQAQTAIHKWRSGGSTSTSAAGGVLNPAGNQQTDQAIWTIPYLWQQISLETGAINQAGGGMQSVIAAKDLEIQGAVDDIKKQASRQLVSNGDGFIAQCTTGGASLVINLLPQASGGLGYDAIARGWLFPGLPVDIGTVGDSDLIATGSLITDVNEDPVTPTITISNSVSTTASHFVSIANPNSATATNPELNGFRNMFGSTTSILGGINPATAGEAFWKPAVVDSTTTSLTIDGPLQLQQRVFQKTGVYGTQVFTSAKQAANFYSLLQNQVRFTGEQGMGAGGVGGTVGLKWNGLGVNVIPDIVDKEWYMITLDDLIRVTGQFKKPIWTSEIEGAGQGLRWGQGTTAFNEGLVFAFQVGTRRRNTGAALTNLVS